MTRRSSNADEAEFSNVDLVRGILADVGGIVRGEIDLAVMRARGPLRQILGITALLSAAAVLAIAGVGLALHAYVLALTQILPPAAAYAIVGLSALLPAVSAWLYVAVRGRHRRPIQGVIEARGAPSR
jgi:hypothetical protein